jgi:hypothetical protein
MPAELALKNKDIPNDGKTAGLLLCNLALELHAIEAPDRCTIVI